MDEQEIATSYPDLLPEGSVFDHYGPRYNVESNNIYFEAMISQPGVVDKLDSAGVDIRIGCISVHDLVKLATLAVHAPDKIEETILGFMKTTDNEILDPERITIIKNQLQLDPPNFTKRTDKLLFKNGKPSMVGARDITIFKSKYKLDTTKGLSRDEKYKLGPREREVHDQIMYKTLLNQRKKLLQALLPENMTVEQLPAKYRNHILEIRLKSFDKIFGNRIKAMLKDLKRRQKDIPILTDADGPNPPKSGDMAKFLAYDIVDMIVDVSTKQRITSVYAIEIQRLLALFGGTKNQLSDILYELRLFDNQNGHVFLNRTMLNESRGILEFYMRYLRAKVKWIEKNFRNKKGALIFPNNITLPYSLSKLKARYDHKVKIEQWAERKKTMPVYLPKTLFDNSVRQVLVKALAKADNYNREKDAGLNFSLLMAKLSDNDAQDFYTLKRQYRTKGRIMDVDISKLSHSKLKRKLGTRAERNEKRIRFERTKDRVLLSICKHMVSKMSGANNITDELRLLKMGPNTASSPLDLPAVFEFNLPGARKIKVYTGEYKNNGNLDNGTEWTYRKFGKFKRYLRDRRLTGLSEYLILDKVHIDFIAYQLGEYEIYREKIFELCFRLEEMVSQRYFQQINIIHSDKDENFIQVQFGTYMELLKSEGILSNDESDFLRAVRNGFSHNTLPLKVAQHIDFFINDQNHGDFIRSGGKTRELRAKGISIPCAIHNSFEVSINEIIEVLKS